MNQSISTGLPASDGPVLPSFVRASGELRASFARPRARTFAVDTYEQGGLRLRFPVAAGACEAVIINTAGGMAGGDQARFRFEAGANTDVTITTQSAEKIYRSQGPACEVELALRLASAARLAWLPQETILFDAARLVRRLDVEMAPDASLTIVESVVFGRLAMGETSTSGAFRDRWRIRRDGRLVFAEEVRLEGEIGHVLGRPAGGGGGRMAATILHVAPDAEQKLEGVRMGIESAPDAVECGASAWNGMLIVRMLAAEPARGRGALARVLGELRGRAMPRVWQ
jgi:urease accessory protein